MSLALLPYKGDNGGSSDAASPGDTNACRSPGKLMAKKSTDLLDKQESWDHRVNKTDVSILEGSPRRCPKPDRFAEIASEDLLQNALHQKLPGKRVPCGKCENCLKDDCGECWKCQFKQENNKSGGVCIRKICTNHQTSKPSVLEEASATEASSKKSRRHPCGSCENCLKEDCGQCNKCLHRAKGKPSRGVCVRRKCLNYQRSSSDAGSVSSSTSVRRNRSRRMVFPDPEEGDKVYAKWKENGVSFCIPAR